MTTWFRSPGVRRCAGVFLAALLGSGPVIARSASPAQGPPTVVLPAPWMVSGDTGLLFVSVKPAQTAEFEAGIAALKDVLIESPRVDRQRQRAGWRIYKQVEPWGGGVVYLFLVQPAVPGVDYSVAGILAEGRPDNRTAEVAYVNALSGQQTLLDCSLVVDLGTGAPVGALHPDAIPLPATPVEGFQAPLFAPVAAAALAPAPVSPTVPAAVAAAAPPALPPGDPLASQPVVASSAVAVAGSEPRVFSGDLGLLLMQVKSRRLADFESTLLRLKTALASSPDAGRQAQAAGWRVFKAVPPLTPATPVKREKSDEDDEDGETVTVVFVIDPPVPAADYTVSRILSDMYPAESSTLFRTYRRAFVGGVTPLSFTLLSDLRY